MKPTFDDDATRHAMAARDGDPVAVAAFVRATQADVWRLCAALVDSQSADDLTQECYLRALKALPGFAGRSTVRTWLLGIARRTCADHLRKLSRYRRLDARLRINTRPEAVAPHESVAIADLLDRLPPARRTAFVLTQLAGLSYAEVAEIEKVAVGTIRSRVARARSELISLYSLPCDVEQPLNGTRSQSAPAIVDPVTVGLSVLRHTGWNQRVMRGD